MRFAGKRARIMDYNTVLTKRPLSRHKPYGSGLFSRKSGLLMQPPNHFPGGLILEFTDFLKWLGYLAAISFGSFLVGRLLPYRWFDAGRFPYRSAAFEKAFYQKLGLPKWQKKLPDMSKIFSHLMPAKAMTDRTPDGLQTMIEETCIAEFIHAVLAVLGFGGLLFWHSWAGIILTLVYVIGNIPFILIQRYNRPRLMRLKALAERRKERFA